MSSTTSTFLDLQSPSIFTLKAMCSHPYRKERQVRRSKASKQISLLVSSYLMEKRHDYDSIFLMIIIIIIFLKTTLPLCLKDLQTEEPTLQYFL